MRTTAQDTVGNQGLLERLGLYVKAAEGDAEGVFDRSITDSGDSGTWAQTKALVAAVIEEPVGVVGIVGEAFVEDELKSFVGGMDVANDLAALSPSPEVQKLVTWATKPLANAVDFFAGAIRGDKERMRDAVEDTLTETATDVVTGKVTDGLGIKTGDGRVSAIGFNQAGGMSHAAQEAITNNVVLDQLIKHVQELAAPE